jgi:hypothetical protein
MTERQCSINHDDDEYESLLRELALEKYGSKKGSLSEIIKEALKKLKETLNLNR